MACPPRFKSMQSFWRYYAGAARAPVPTVFIGGNHEAASHLLSLRYGGWAAPGVLFLGSAGAVRFGGLRLAGVSGIFKGYDFATGFHERAPLSEDAVRSANHQREFDFWCAQHLAGRAVDIFLSQ